MGRYWQCSVTEFVQSGPISELPRCPCVRTAECSLRRCTIGVRNSGRRRANAHRRKVRRTCRNVLRHRLEAAEANANGQGRTGGTLFETRAPHSVSDSGLYLFPLIVNHPVLAPECRLHCVAWSFGPIRLVPAQRMLFFDPMPTVPVSVRVGVAGQ